MMRTPAGTWRCVPTLALRMNTCSSTTASSPICTGPIAMTPCLSVASRLIRRCSAPSRLQRAPILAPLLICALSLRVDPMRTWSSITASKPIPLPRRHLDMTGLATVRFDRRVAGGEPDPRLPTTAAPASSQT